MPWRRRAARWRLQTRRPTGFLRDLPDLLIVGTQRGGTSSLYRYLGRHPSVEPSIRKEVDFFSVRFGEGVNWYRAHFPMRFPSRFTFEATPDYLLHPLAAERAHRVVPEAKVIVMLRDPVQRAYSQYQHNRRLGNEPLTFAEALAAEPERTAGEIEKLIADPGYPGVNLRRFGYVARSTYHDQVRRWLDAYGPDRMMVIKSEDFFADPGAVYEGVLEFVGLPPVADAEFRNYSIRREATPSKSLPVERLEGATYDRLVEAFADHNDRVYRLLDRDFGWISSKAEK